MTATDLEIFYKKVIEKYKKGEYKIRGRKDKDFKLPKIYENLFGTYALNYIIYEYCINTNDERWKSILDFVLIPVGSLESMEKINIKKYGLEFCEDDFDEFYEFMIRAKS